jgi:hypothetical protein
MVVSKLVVSREWNFLQREGPSLHIMKGQKE